MKSLTAVLLIVAGLIINTNILFGQTDNRVIHASGTEEVAGINVTVSQSGLVDSAWHFCESTSPYWIGYNRDTAFFKGNGTYFFDFSPPVDYLTLRFSYVSVDDLIVIHVNDNHYEVTSLGDTNDCHRIAVITPSGNITGSVHYHGVGTDKIIIPGKIRSLNVANNVLTTELRWFGTFFSLYLNDSSTTNIFNKETGLNTDVYPSPFKNKLNVISGNNEKTNISIYDIMGKVVLQKDFIKLTALNTKELPVGLYLYIIETKSGKVNIGKCLKIN